MLVHKVQKETGQHHPVQCSKGVQCAAVMYLSDALLGSNVRLGGFGPGS